MTPQFQPTAGFSVPVTQHWHEMSREQRLAAWKAGQAGHSTKEQIDLADAYRKRAAALREIVAKSKEVCFLIDMMTARADEARASQLERGQL